MSIPPGAPANYGAGQPAVTVGQPPYNVPPPQGLVGGSYQPHALPGGPTGYQGPTMHTQQPPAQMYMPSSTSSAPQPPPPGTVEYQQYNMQGMCHSAVASFWFVV